jgi:hypothetical protein
MIRSIKTLGVALIAVLVMSALAVSAAGASNFTASSYPTAGAAISEKGNDDIKTEAGSTECKVSYAMDAITGPSEVITVTPTFTECQSFGFLSATVNMNGCDYVYHTNGAWDIVCSGSNMITIVSSTCEMKIGAQVGLKSIAFSNSGSGISAKANVGGIAYSVTKDGFLCPFNGTGAKTGATYTQNLAIQFNSTNGAVIDIG